MSVVSSGSGVADKAFKSPLREERGFVGQAVCGEGGSFHLRSLLSLMR